MNACNERFKRTIQEEFVDYQEDLLLDDLRGFNDQLLEYLQRYNGERPHFGVESKPSYIRLTHCPLRPKISIWMSIPIYLFHIKL